MSENTGPLNTHIVADMVRAAVTDLNEAIKEAGDENLSVEVKRDKKSGFFTAVVYRTTYIFPTEGEDGQLSLDDETKAADPEINEDTPETPDDQATLVDTDSPGAMAVVLEFQQQEQPDEAVHE